MLVCLTVACCACGTLAACGVADGEKIDKSKTQLYVGNYKGGYGDAWLRGAKKRFEALYKDKSFEAGKTGVQIVIDNGDRSICGTSLFDKIALSNNELFFTESIYYQDFVSAGKLLDITDAVTEPLSEFDEDRSIEDKMFSYHIDTFKTQNKYYGLPFYEAFHGIIYDVDLFENELLYFAADADNGNDGFILDLEDARGAGPDNKPNTSDDGLPATYAQFYALCERIKQQGLQPIIWSGQYPAETSKTLSAMQADYEGAEQMMLNVTFRGEATDLVDTVDRNGNMTFLPPTEITKDNGYLLAKQAGKYKALEFFDTIIENRYYADLTFNTAMSNTGAQEEYLYSSMSRKKTPIAMLVDGTYWENEATGIFTDMVNGGYGERAAKENRRFALMPYPKADEQKLAAGNPTVFTDINYSTALVNAKIEAYKIPLAKAFLRFLHTDGEMREYNVATNTPKPFRYTMTDADLARLTYYGRSLFALHATGTIVYPASTEEVFYRNQAILNPTDRPWASIVNGTSYGIPVTALKNADVDAKGYFEGISNARGQAYWNNYVLSNL